VYMVPEGDGYTLKSANPKDFLGRVPNFDSVFEANAYAREWGHEMVPHP
jgi:hypothetical protein